LEFEESAVISFAFTKTDEDILEDARAQAKLAEKYARDFENDEDRCRPHAYPEAEGRPDTRRMLSERKSETSGAKILHTLLYLEDWRGGVPLRESRYSLGNTVLRLAGSPEQYARWADETIAIALTEPIGGSDPAAIRTTATWDDKTGEWIIDGEKIFITYASSCEAALVLARIVHPERRGLSTFIVDKGASGFVVGPQFRKMGIRFEDTASLSFSGCRVPAVNHIDGDLKQTLRSFSESRPVVAAYALGVTRAVMDFAWARLAEIGVFPDYDKPLAGLSAAAARMIELETEWEATWITVLRAKWIEQEEGPGKIESSIAKVMGGSLARKATQACIEILGPVALSEDHPPEKAFRDSRIFDIYEGTGEIQRLIIAREILGYSPKELN
jgi:acyl-CoA dehydrogenase